MNDLHSDYPKRDSDPKSLTNGVGVEFDICRQVLYNFAQVARFNIGKIIYTIETKYGSVLRADIVHKKLNKTKGKIIIWKQKGFAPHFYTDFRHY